MKKKDKKIKELPWRFYGKSILIISVATTIFSFGESLLFEDYCDINSMHYQDHESRLSLAKKIKAQFNKTDPNSFFGSIFT